jgi:hypothetical protein
LNLDYLNKSDAAFGKDSMVKEKDATEQEFFGEQDSGVFSQANQDLSRDKSAAEFEKFKDGAIDKSATDLEYINKSNASQPDQKFLDAKS